MTLGDWLLSFFLIFMWVAWIWLVITILIDIFRSDDLSGWGKAGWTILVVFFTWIGVLIYLIARGTGMNERRFADAAREQRAQADYIRQVREAGARISLISDGDIQAAIATCIHGNGIDIMLGIGGSPEAVTTACAMAALRGEIQCKLWPRDEAERAYATDHGLDLEQVLTTRDLVDSDNTF